MYLLGHEGTAVALGYLGQRLAKGAPLNKNPQQVGLDFRLLMLGVMVPDILDKTLGLWVFHTTRAIGHTFLFNIFLLGLVFLWGKRRLFIFPLASLLHLVQDRLWEVPEVLLWPVYGWAFPPRGLEDLLWKILNSLLTDPAVYIPELVGAFVLFALGWRLRDRQRRALFLRQGLLH